MKSLLALCLLVAFCANSFGQDDAKCKNDLKAFLECAKSSTSESQREAKKKELQAKGDQCFQQAGCDAPNWDSNPMGGRGGAGGAHGMSMPESVKTCLKEKMAEKVGAKLNDCLAKRGVRNVDWKALADGAEGAGFGGPGGSGDMQKGMMAIFNAVKAVDKCCQQKKGGDTNAVKPLEQCLHDTKKGIRPQVCAALKPCEAKVSAPCKTRGEEIRKALCECKKEKELEIAGKLRTLGQQQQKVPIQDLIKTVANDQEINDIMGDVEACYKDNNEPEPAMLKLAMLMMKNGGSGGGSAGGRMGASMAINGTTCIIMSDMLTLDANDKSECEKCP